MGFVLYRSSAGSGKTCTLVKEYLKIILQEPKNKNILAYSFTLKAAGEMRIQTQFVPFFVHIVENTDRRFCGNCREIPGAIGIFL